MTKIPHLLREIFLESGQKLWVVDEVTVFFSVIVYEWQTKGRKRQRKQVNLPQNSHYTWNIFFFKRSMRVLLLIVRSQHSSKLYLQYNAFYCFAFLLIQELGIALGFPMEK